MKWLAALACVLALFLVACSSALTGTVVRYETKQVNHPGVGTGIFSGPHTTNEKTGYVFVKTDNGQVKAKTAYTDLKPGQTVSLTQSGATMIASPSQ
jgi:hypothetical protein